MAESHRKLLSALLRVLVARAISASELSVCMAVCGTYEAKWVGGFSFVVGSRLCTRGLVDPCCCCGWVFCFVLVLIFSS